MDSLIKYLRGLLLQPFIEYIRHSVKNRKDAFLETKVIILDEEPGSRQHD
jgi:hypothetical protein